MRKGFFFTLDTFFAILIAIVLIAGITISLGKSSESSFTKIYLAKKANDALVFLDKNQTLETLDQTKIQNTLQEILPSQLNASLRLRVYNLATTFNLENTITATKPNNSVIPSSDDVGYASRLFVTFSSQRIDKYVAAEIWVWLA